VRIAEARMKHLNLFALLAFLILIVLIITFPGLICMLAVVVVFLFLFMYLASTSWFAEKK
jgi:VIT1/CCC1 family predicted Fe2+/Mn2+ transporter